MSGSRTLRIALAPEQSSALESARTQTLCSTRSDPHRAACLATIRTASIFSTAPVGGLRPADLASLYDFPQPASQRATSQVVGIVVAGDYPSAAADLAVYRARYGLAPCTYANGCFRKVGADAPSAAVQSGALPQSVSANPTGPDDLGWAAETDADTEAVSAVCAGCRIVLAEAASDDFADLGAAVSAAVAAGASIVDTSFGAPEDASQLRYEPLFEPGSVKVVAAAGDWGPGVLFPAGATNVVAVAGTTVHSLGLVAYETPWSLSGGGCSQIFSRPSWQFGLTCGKRSVADVAAVGDPATGLSFYDSSLLGWGVSGGTSVSAPIIAAMWALTGASTPQPGAQYLYQHSLGFLGVVGGSNTGLGTPNGLLGF